MFYISLLENLVISCCVTSQDYGPELLPGDVCVYKFVWRTPAACPLNVKAERPHEDDSCTVGIPGTINRYGDVQSGALPPGIQ